MHDIIQQVETRLPELEWKLEAVACYFNKRILPPGLFREQFEVTPKSCIDEIKQDIKIFRQQTNTQSSSFLAQRIHRKINVLVRFCQIYTPKIKPNAQTSFGVRAISTRQQWLQSLEQDIERLTQQQQALLKRLETVNLSTDASTKLELQTALGEIERNLTLAKETQERAVRY